MIKKHNSSSSGTGIIGSVGDQQNYIVMDTPCLIPKENIKFFNNLQKEAQHSSFGDYPNPFNSFWNGKH